MNQKMQTQPENAVEKEGFIKPHQKKLNPQPRQKIRQLLRSFLPMDSEYRELKEEQTLFR